MKEIKFILIGVCEGSMLYYIDDDYKEFNIVYDRKTKVKCICYTESYNDKNYIAILENGKKINIYNNITIIG